MPVRPADYRGHAVWAETQDLHMILLVARGVSGLGHVPRPTRRGLIVEFGWLPYTMGIRYHPHSLVVVLPEGTVARFDMEPDRVRAWAAALEADFADEGTGPHEGDMSATLRELAAADNRDDVLQFLEEYDAPPNWYDADWGISDLLRHDVAAIRRWAAERLGPDWPSVQEAVPALTDLLNDADPSVRKAAAEALRRIRQGDE
jgi:hypothetical protein